MKCDFVSISFSGVTRYFSTVDHMRIYDYLRSLGLGHVDSAEVASWAELASVGDTYEVFGFLCEIRICGDSNI